MKSEKQNPKKKSEKLNKIPDIKKIKTHSGWSNKQC